MYQNYGQQNHNGHHSLQMNQMNGMQSMNNLNNGYNNQYNNGYHNNHAQKQQNQNNNQNDIPPPPPSGPPPPINKQKSSSRHGHGDKKRHHKKDRHKKKNNKGGPPNKQLPNHPSGSSQSSGYGGHQQRSPPMTSNGGYNQMNNNQNNKYNQQQQQQQQQAQKPNYHQYAASYQNGTYNASFANLPQSKTSTLQPNPQQYFQGSVSTGNLMQHNGHNAHNTHNTGHNGHQSHHSQQPSNQASPWGVKPNNTGYNNHHSQQQSQKIQNSYTQISNPAAVFQNMQNGSTYGSFIGSNMQIGSNRNLAAMAQQQQNGAVYQKQLPNNPSGGYGIQQPSHDFVQQYGPYGGYAYPYNPNQPFSQSQMQFYPNQPSGGGDSIVPPPPMVQAPNGEMIPTADDPANGASSTSTDKKKKKKKRHKHDKDGKRKHKKHKRDKDGKRISRRHKDKHKDGKSRSSSRSKHKSHRKKKSSKSSSGGKDESPPPPPPPSNKLLPPGPGGGSTLPPNPGGRSNHDSDDDGSSTSVTSESEDFKEAFGADDGNIPDASTVFKNQVNKQKKKGKHGRFESKNQFIRRRPVSGVPMSVQKQLHGVNDDQVSSHLKLIHKKRCEKTNDTVSFLKECLLKEVLFQGMDNGMIDEIVETMYRVDCPKGECIIRQGEYGDAYFVIQSGAFDIIHQEMANSQSKIVGEMLPGKAFGEGSLLYSIPRAATLKATKACVVWALDATKFLEIRQKISQQVNDKCSKIVRFLKKVELFKKYHHQDLVAIGQAATERKYNKNARIVVQGDEATEFFLIKTGACIAAIKMDDGKEQTVKKYSDGDYFGERGLYKNEKRAASVIATSTTRVYAIKAHDFKKLLADPLSKHFEEQIKKYDEVAFDNGIKRPFQNLIDCKLEQFDTLGILGVGSFGRVSLVRDPKTEITYSLKKVRKNKVIETGQQEHVRNERAVLATLDSDFCVKLYGTYQDELNIYFLMEPVLGGELFTVLRWNKRFSEKTARFYAACVVLAFESLHAKNIIYRDLKPENLLIHKNGYCKLVDFGFAKKRNNSCTLCGTPEYLSPEVIQNYSQGFAVDWWALGIFVYEMVVGHAPFQDDPNVKMYEKILTFDVDFPGEPKLTPRVEHLICGLLEKDAYRRLGAGTNGTQQILNHPWFHGLNWDEMRQQKIAPPYVPNINGADDLSHYDAYDEENIQEKLDPDASKYEWCEDF